MDLGCVSQLSPSRKMDLKTNKDCNLLKHLPEVAEAQAVFLILQGKGQKGMLIEP